MWNGYFNALIYLRSDNLYTLQLILRSILILNQVAVDSQSIEMLNIAEEKIKASNLKNVELKS